LLKQAEDEGQLKLYYFDESGFSLVPCIPYGWQRIGETHKLPLQRSQRINVLGFLSRQNESFFHTVESSVRTEDVICAFDQFAETYRTEYQHTYLACIIVLDNASIHHSGQFKARIDHWKACGLCLHFLPAYSPELNLIEILWRKMKYEWLPFEAYQSYSQLKSSILDILEKTGSKYRITFA